MNRTAGLLLLALVATAGGCSGGSGDRAGNPSGGNPPPPPPSPPPPTTSVGGIWIGELEKEVSGDSETRTSLDVRALVTEDGTFRLILDEPSQQIVGEFYAEGTDLNLMGGLFWYENSYWITASASNQGWFWLHDGTVDERTRLTGSFKTTWPDSSEYTGSFSLDYDPLYERDSSYGMLAGSYSGSNESLNIDGSGAVFYQSSMTGCVANGAADLIDTDFNLYSVTVEVRSCNGNERERNGRSYTGLAYLSDSAAGSENDILEIAMSLPISDVPSTHEGVIDHYIWNLSVHR